MSRTYAVNRKSRSSQPGSEPIPREPRRTYTNQEIVASIHQWVTQYGAAPLSADWDIGRARRYDQATRVARYEMGSWPSTRVVRRAFGTFNGAIRAAGYTPVPAPSRIAGNLRNPTEVLHAIQAWTARYGETPTMADWDPHRARRLGQEWRITRYQEGDWPSVRTVCRHFGNISTAILAAGLDPRPQGGRAARQTQAQRELLSVLRDQRTLDPVEGASSLLALRVTAVVNARNADDRLILRGSLIQLASTALIWAEEITPEEPELSTTDTTTALATPARPAFSTTES